MFEYISGKLIQKTKDYAVIDAGGIGYRIYSTMSSLSSLGEAGDTARLYIYMNIKNSSDTFSLYGFATPEERSTFEMILGVSGIGAKTAAALLSNVSTSKFALCVVTNDSKYLSSHTPGLGPKGAQRIILELKDKFKNVELDNVPQDEIFAADTDDSNEALSALMVLGYAKSEAERALAGADGTVENMIKYATERLFESGYEPYYLYRQKNQLGNQENIGWTKPGLGGIYNVNIMEEVQTIIAVGAGGTTKIIDGGFERFFNPKYPLEYIKHFDTVLARKEEAAKLLLSAGEADE